MGHGGRWGTGLLLGKNGGTAQPNRESDHSPRGTCPDCPGTPRPACRESFRTSRAKGNTWEAGHEGPFGTAFLTDCFQSISMRNKNPPVPYIPPPFNLTNRHEKRIVMEITVL